MFIEVHAKIGKEVQHHYLNVNHIVCACEKAGGNQSAIYIADSVLPIETVETYENVKLMLDLSCAARCRTK